MSADVAATLETLKATASGDATTVIGEDADTAPQIAREICCLEAEVVIAAQEIMEAVMRRLAAGGRAELRVVVGSS